MDWRYVLFQFDGRINRGKWWAGMIAVGVGVWIVALIAAIADSTVVWTIYALVALLAIWPYLAIAIKRWHDRGKSGWWVLIALIPLIGPFWALIETGFLKGDDGPNEYGPNPLVA